MLGPALVVPVTERGPSLKGVADPLNEKPRVGLRLRVRHRGRLELRLSVRVRARVSTCALIRFRLRVAMNRNSLIEVRSTSRPLGRMVQGGARVSASGR